MKKLILIISIIAMVIGLGKAISAAVSGETVYEQNCSRCHATRSPVERSDRQWKIIVNHMRVKANLTAEETKEVLKYLQASN